MKNTQDYSALSRIKHIVFVFAVVALLVSLFLPIQSVGAADDQKDDQQSSSEQSYPKDKQPHPKKDKRDVDTTAVQTVQQVAKPAAADPNAGLRQRCVARKNAITRIATKYNGAAQSYQTELDNRLARLTEIQQDLGLSSPEINSLVESAKIVKQDEVLPLVTKLHSTAPAEIVHCESGNFVGEVRSYRDLARSTKDALNNYRQSIKAVALAMKELAHASVVK